MISRRGFLAGLCGGILGLARVSEAKASFDLGIGTYTYRGLSLKAMIEDLKALQIHHIELSSPDYFLPGVKLDSIPSLRTELTDAKIAPVSYFCGDIKTEDDINRTVQVARALGARHVSGAAVGDTLKGIDTRFSRENLKFGIHNHWFRGRRFAYESPEDLLNALETLSPTVGVTLDAGHMASCGYDPVEALDKLWPHLQLVHLKDVERSGDDKNVVLGTGIAKSKAVIAKLKDRGFSGLVAIEYEAAVDNPQPDVIRCVDFARASM